MFVLFSSVEEAIRVKNSLRFNEPRVLTFDDAFSIWSREWDKRNPIDDFDGSWDAHM